MLAASSAAQGPASHSLKNDQKGARPPLAEKLHQVGLHPVPDLLEFFLARDLVILSIFNVSSVTI
jgi:hypothetical protein